MIVTGVADALAGEVSTKKILACKWIEAIIDARMVDSMW